MSSQRQAFVQWIIEPRLRVELRRSSTDAETEQKAISVRVVLMICFMKISACGKVCPKILAESRWYKEIDRRRARKRKYSLVVAEK